MFNWTSPKTQQSTNSSTNSSFGIKLPENNKVAAVELDSIVKTYKDRSQKIDAHLKKAAKDRELANKLAASYIHNYYVMIDISVLLNQYAEFFKSIKDVLSSSDIQLEQLNSQNFQNLERLTRQEMDKFTHKFGEQAQKVRKLFVDYNMSEQAAKLDSIPSLTNQVSSTAENVMRLNKPNPTYGGQKKHIKKKVVIKRNGTGQKKKGSKA